MTKESALYILKYKGEEEDRKNQCHQGSSFCWSWTKRNRFTGGVCKHSQTLRVFPFLSCKWCVSSNHMNYEKEFRQGGAAGNRSNLQQKDLFQAPVSTGRKAKVCSTTGMCLSFPFLPHWLKWEPLSSTWLGLPKNQFHLVLLFFPK